MTGLWAGASVSTMTIYLPLPLQCHPQWTPYPNPAVGDNFPTTIATVRLCQAGNPRMRSLTTPPNMSSFIQPFTSSTICQAVNWKLGTQKWKKHDPALSGPWSGGGGQMPSPLPPSALPTASLPVSLPFSLS